MGLFDLLNRAVDWAADQIQTSTGEKDRRQYVERLKSLAHEFKEKVGAAIDQLNRAIDSFNENIRCLNELRSKKVRQNIAELFGFLNKFGNCKPAGDYTNEDQKLPTEFPQRNYDALTNYISDVDWSQDEVFINSFFLTPIGMKIKTRKQNLSMQEHIHEFQLQMDETLKELELQKFNTEQDIQICTLYVSNVEFISEFIKERIIPELELVEAFFQAEKIKNQVIADRQLEDVSFSYQINTLKGTPYEKHYQFVKNVLMFYVLSCKIYDTPVLSNLLNARTTQEDVVQLKAEKQMLTSQADMVSNSMYVRRG